MSLLRHGGRRELNLAEAVFRATPLEANGFAPVVAADILLTFPDLLSASSARHLRRIIHEYLLYVIEWRFSTPGVHNFTAMYTFLLLAAGRLLDHYRFDHRFAAIPAVYSADRLRDLGRNALRLLLHDSQSQPTSHEFNSPTYTPITLLMLGKIVDHESDEPELLAMARRVEAYVWREVLAMYHPVLGVPCGPFSRAYMTDVAGHTSRMRVRARSRELLFDARPLTELAPVPTSALSFNTLITAHFQDVEEIALDGQRLGDTPLVKRASCAVCAVRDGAMSYRIEYRFREVVTMRLGRWGHFLRFGAFAYEGRRKTLTEKYLRSIRCRGSLRVAPNFC